jgi:DNA-binding NarL/FixJ family response regulator
MHLETVLPAAAGVLSAADDEERAVIAVRLQLLMGLVAQRFDHADRRARWFRSPLGRELTQLADAPIPEQAPKASAEASPSSLPPDGAALLHLLAEGQTNHEIAATLGVTDEEVGERLAALFAAIGARSRVDATTAALTGRLI